MQLPLYLADIFEQFNGRLVGSNAMKRHVVEVVAKLDQANQQHIIQGCWFVSTLEDAWAFTLSSQDLEGKHVIFLGDELLRQSTSQIYHTIAHEIGHVLLGHRNSTFTKQSKEEIALQEKEADYFAKGVMTG